MQKQIQNMKLTTQQNAVVWKTQTQGFTSHECQTPLSGPPVKSVNILRTTGLSWNHVENILKELFEILGEASLFSWQELDEKINITLFCLCG